MQVEMIADYACVCGEGPVWHPGQKRLYWTDIETGRMFWFNPASRQHEQCYEGPRVGGMTVQADGTLLLFRDAGNVCVWDDGRVVRDVVKEIPAVAAAGGRFNDVWADPRGRVFCGTLGAGCGFLFRLDLDGSLHEQVREVGCANGIDFSDDQKTMYFTDSGARTIDIFDYNVEGGRIALRRNLVLVPEGQGVPDGMVLDNQGRIWSARWDGSGVYCYDGQTGRELSRIEIPARKCSSVVFGGEDYRDMYLTSAGGNQKATDGEHAGALFRVRGSGAQGRPAWPSRVQL